MSQVPLWYEREFAFTFPVEQHPNLSVRLRGTPAQLEEMLRGLARERLVHKPEGKWSIQEHAGHLLDLESLWLRRVENFFEPGSETLAVTDLSNRQVDSANFNARPAAEILGQFRTARRKLSERIDEVSPESFARTRLHPRLQQPMRLVDHLYFVAEHDDHHLAKIWELATNSH
jgi:uncharacterized damage-inducible protein DinB